ncbi:hypothetical protein DWB64_13290 [Fusibacter sp. A1]|nr:hypothetical protein [Fusibacter sp. A1]RXV60385.1 hypothetical protein DWB64_13290 [Fusibacter sp. A1]
MITDDMTIKLLILTVIAIGEKAYYEISELSQTAQMFPYNFQVSHEILHNSEEFTLNNFGGKIVLAKD